MAAQVKRPILGESQAVKSMINMISRVAASKTNILVIGESGTGKELVARMIHDSGPLKEKPFVPVNCGAIPVNLIESEMFGHKKGSFTGAVNDKPGLFEAADGGTLFLDEVGELPVGMQVKLLRAIQERIIRRVGANEDTRVDVRIIAATNRDLEAAVAAGTFREDLYYRLNVILIKTPPLRERKGDIQLLAHTFLEKFCARAGKKLEGFDPIVIAALEAYAWPGNIRELENIVERAVTLENGNKITIADFPAQIQAFAARVAPAAGASTGGGQGSPASAVGGLGGPAGASVLGSEIRLPAPDFTKGALNLDAILGDVERTYLLAALEQTGGVKKRAAELLGITFRSIRYRLSKLGMDAGGEDE
jgi:two-component system response regulator PilR (NtrC family)